MPTRPAGRRPERWPFVLAGVGLLLILGFAATFKSYSTPSGSMLPTLEVGDYLLARRVLPFARAPEAGDVVFFPLPRDPSSDWVKRVVAVGGDTVQMRGGVPVVNGAPVRQERLPDRSISDDGVRTVVQTWRETLPNGRSYLVYRSGAGGQLDDTPVVRVPPGSLFVLGDNRDNSLDSRIPSGMGTETGMIPAASVIARSGFVFWSGDGSRIGTSLAPDGSSPPGGARN